MITEAKLKLAPDVKEKVDTKAEPGTILSQTPKAGEKAEEGGEVALLVAIGDGKVTVPDLTGKSPADAEKALREKNLSLGQVTPQPPDPKGEIKTQIPAAGETVSEGKPVDIFLVVKKADGTVVAAKPGGGEEEGGGGGGGGGDGGDEGGPLKVPEIDGAAPGRLRAEGRRPRPRPRRSSASSTRTSRRARSSASTRSRAPRSSPATTSPSSCRPASPSSPTTTTATCCASAARRAPSAPPSPRAPRRRRTRPGAPTAAASPTRATARSSSATS